MSALNDPATLDEIALVRGKSKRSIERWSIKDGWKYTEAASHSRHKKRLYALKDLPQDIQFAVMKQRQEAHITLYSQQMEQQHEQFNTRSTLINAGTAGGVRQLAINNPPI